MKKHLNLNVNGNEIIATGDTYNAKEALKAAGFKGRKIGYEWQYVSNVDPKTAITNLANELYRLAQPAIEKHLTEAAQAGFTPHPYDFAWTVTVVAGGREAHYFAMENLVPAWYEAGQLKPVQ
jgi:hypothetical protein